MLQSTGENGNPLPGTQWRITGGRDGSGRDLFLRVSVVIPPQIPS